MGTDVLIRAGACMRDGTLTPAKLVRRQKEFLHAFGQDGDGEPIHIRRLLADWCGRPGDSLILEMAKRALIVTVMATEALLDTFRDGDWDGSIDIQGLLTQARNRYAKPWASLH